MPLGFIIGKSGYGKSHYCMQEILKNESNDSPQVLIVPEQFTSQAERDLLMLSNNHILLHSEVLSFGRIAQRIFNANGIGDKTILDDISKSMALQKILLEEQDNLIYFKKFIDKSGFIEQLSLTFSEFSQYNINPVELLEIAKQEGLPTIVQEKLQDISLIYNKYFDFLAEDYLPKDEKLTILSTLLNKGNMFSETTFYIDGFYDFTPQEVTVIEKLLQFSKNVYVTLPMTETIFNYDTIKNYSPFFKPYLTKKRLVDLGTDLLTNVFLTENKRTEKQGLINLEEHFFNGYYETCNLADGITLMNLPTKEKEIIAIAGEVLTLVKSGKARYRDISILTNDLESYVPLFISTLNSFDIPYFIDTKRAITTHPLITMVQSLLDLFSFNFSYKSMFAYLRTNLTNVTEDEIDILENYALAYGIKSYKWTGNKEWTYGLNSENQEEINNINRIRETIINPLLPLIDICKQKTIVFKDLVNAIIDHMKELKIDEKMTEMRDKATEKQLFEKADEHKQVFKMILEIFEKTKNILGDVEIPFIHQQKILVAGISKCKIGVIPPSIDCIVVGDFERSRLPELKYLFVAGVNEGVLPSPSSSQGIFSETERDILMAVGVEMATSSKQLAYHEQLLIYSGLTKPSEQLYMSYFSGDLEGKPFYPSSVINKIRQMDNELETITPTEFVPERNTPQTALNYLGEALTSDKITPFWGNMYNFYKEDDDLKKHIDIIKSAIFKDPPQKLLNKETAEVLYGKKIHSSVSRLERYNSCPFSYFVEYTLKAKPRKMYTLEAPDLGNLFHEVLEKFFLSFTNEVLDKLPQDEHKKAWNKLQKLPDPSLQSKSVKEYVDEIVDDVSKNLGAGILTDTASHTYLVNRLKRISLTACWTCVLHIIAGDFRPIKYELSFGTDSQDDLPPIKNVLSDGEELILTGKIDRVDLYSKNDVSFVKVVDYKSGKIKFDLQKIYHGLQLQLFVYMGAYLNSELNQEMDLEPAGAFYFKVVDPKIKVQAEDDVSQIETLLYRELKTKGIVVDNETSVCGLDNHFNDAFASYDNQSASDIIPLKLKKIPEPKTTSTKTKKAPPKEVDPIEKYDAKSSSVTSADDFNSLVDYVNQKTVEIGNKIKSGNIEPNPYKQSSHTPCKYCKYKSICIYEYDVFPRYNILSSVSKKEFWNMINLENENNEDMEENDDNN